MPTSRPSCGRRITRPHRSRRGRGGDGSESGFRLSPRMKNANTRFPAQMAEAVHPGPAAPHQSALTAPSAGPKIKPNPNAIPITAIPFERFSGVVTSDTYALATEILPPVNPSSNLAIKNQRYVVADASKK